MNRDTTVTVLGAGYVGLTTGAILANCGFKTFVVEPNAERLNTIKQGRSFFYEQGLDALIKPALDSGMLIPTDSYEESVPNSGFVFSCVGTPDNPDGSSNLTYVFNAAEAAAQLMETASIYIQKSTVPVGTGQRVQELFAKLGKSFPYVSNPEFLREGTALADSLYFDRVVVGSDRYEDAAKVAGLYRVVEQERDRLVKITGIEVMDNKGLYIETNLNSAELIKVTANAFLALKISFANSIAKLADHTGADITEVMDAVGADRRIGRAFLNAGRGYGGGCFPKDVSGLISSATEHGVDLGIMTAASEVNETMSGYIANKAQAALGGSLKGKKVAVLGLAFKAGTSDARKSPGVKLANILGHDGAKVSVYDPEASHEAKADLRKGIKICDTQAEAITDADGVFITTDWPEFKSIDLADLNRQMHGNLFVDAMNCYDPAQVKQSGLAYIGVGRS